MSAEPISWRAIALAAQRIRQILQVNGYHTNLGDGLVITDRRQIPSFDDAAKYTVVVAGSFSETNRGTRLRNEDMDITIEFGIPLDADGNAECEVHRARADILRAIDAPLRGEAEGIRLIAGKESFIGDAPDGSSYLIAQVSARAGLTETFLPAS